MTFLALLLLSLCGNVSARSERLYEERHLGTCIYDEPIGGVAVKIPEVRVIAERKKKERNRLIVNPDGLVDSTGTPTLGDIFEFIDKNPEKAMELIQDSGQWPYLTVTAGIIASHDAVITNGGRPIPAHLRKTLRRWYPDDLLNAVRWTSIRGPIQKFLHDAQMNFDANTLAITVLNAVIFRSDDLANDGALWAHELYHVQQYREWGVFGFAKKWVDNPSVSGPLEAPAYAREAEARPFFVPR
ncbi:MAG: DUF4157 domain-containing protein [Pseudomonadota bacterium]